MASGTFPNPTDLTDFAPLAERALSTDPVATLRFRATHSAAGGTLGGFVRLPYDVVAGRSLPTTDGRSYDITVSAVDFLAWVDGEGPEPHRRDAHWLTALPPVAGWERVEVVPDSAVRKLVRSGADLARGTTTRSAQESLLKSTVLTATSDTTTVAVPLSVMSALTKMGFLPQQSSAAVDVAPGWVRLTALYGSTFVQIGGGLNLLGGLSL